MDRVLAQVMPWRKGVVADLTAAVTRLVVEAHRTAVVVHTVAVVAVHMQAVEDTAAARSVKT
jgi:hypothetical protein